MSVNNSSIVDLNNSDHSLGSEYDDSDDYFDEELKNGKRDKLIQRDIDENVMHWINLLATSELSDCAILPVVTFKDQFDDEEVERRCNLLKQRLESDLQKSSRFPEVILDSKGGIPKLSSTEKGGIAELEQCLRDVVHSRDGADSVFKRHLESTLCAVTSSVQNILHMFKEKGLKIVHIEDITRQFLENPSTVENFSNPLVTKALRFLSSIGDIMYFDVSKRTCTRPQYLEDYVVLCPNWISTALSLGLRWDPVDSPLAEMTKNSKSKDNETGMWKFGKSFPLFSHEDSIELLSNVNFVKRANKRLSEDGSVAPNTSNDLYHFLQQVCEYSGIFVPFTLTTRNRRKQSYYLVPMISDQEVPTESWSYKVKDESMTTLCHTFSPSGAISSGFMDKIAVEVMRSVFEFSFQHSSTSMRIQQVLFWKNAIYVKVIEEIEDENNKKRSCAAEFFVQMAKIDSPHYVGSDEFRKIIVSAKGYAGVHGEKIWKQGFSSVLESIERLADIHVEGPMKREIICPDCLRQTTAINAHVWDSEDIKYSDDAIACPHGHILHPQLLLGAFDEVDDAASVATVATGVNSVYSSFSTYSTYTSTSYRNADAMIPAVVLVALWDKTSKRIINVGSGFVADSRRGLIITAAHVLFNFEAEMGYRKYKEFFGLPNATALIGVNHQGNDMAVFTYCADIVASDVYNVDGCVLQIKSKFEVPVELNRNYLDRRAEITISSQSEIKQERLERLVMTTMSPRQQEVRVLGYRQTGEGIMAAGRYINRTACVNVGYVCKPGKSNDIHSENDEFVPRTEVIVNCATGGGNSGGPFVNELGEVIGILSRTDHIDKNRCYLTAALELKILLKEARKRCKREKVVFSPHVHL